jgi:hypothetical protein
MDDRVPSRQQDMDECCWRANEKLLETGYRLAGQCAARHAAIFYIFSFPLFLAHTEATPCMSSAEEQAVDLLLVLIGKKGSSIYRGWLRPHSTMTGNTAKRHRDLNPNLSG